MDPVSLALALLVKHPDMAASAVQSATKPAVVDVAKMQESFADLSKQILLCYHHTARFRQSDVVQRPWSRQAQYAADNSAVLRIRYQGLTMTTYEMTVAVMVKEKKVRTAVVADSATVPYSKKCQLEDWTGA